MGPSVFRGVSAGFGVVIPYRMMVLGGRPFDLCDRTPCDPLARRWRVSQQMFFPKVFAFLRIYSGIDPIWSVEKSETLRSKLVKRMLPLRGQVKAKCSAQEAPPAADLRARRRNRITPHLTVWHVSNFGTGCLPIREHVVWKVEPVTFTGGDFS
jgi:hypothetical protein